MCYELECKQETITNPTTEVEYTSMFEGIKEIVWIKKFIYELDMISRFIDLVAFCCDNNGTSAEANESRSYQ